MQSNSSTSAFTNTFDFHRVLCVQKYTDLRNNILRLVPQKKLTIILSNKICFTTDVVLMVNETIRKRHVVAFVIRYNFIH